MLIARIDPKKPDAALLKKAAAVLKHGGLVVYPTETAYALGCDPKDAAAVKKLFALKKRDALKPLPLIAASAKMARAFVKTDQYATMLSDAFWPGPLTLVGPQRKRLASGIASETGELAVRVSPHPVAQALSGKLGRPIVSTSANLSGRKTRYDAATVLRDLGLFPDLVLDAGVLKSVASSTIVRARDGIVEILREGPISEDGLHRALMRRL